MKMFKKEEKWKNVSSVLLLNFMSFYDFKLTTTKNSIQERKVYPKIMLNKRKNFNLMDNFMQNIFNENCEEINFL